MLHDTWHVLDPERIQRARLENWQINILHSRAVNRETTRHLGDPKQCPAVQSVRCYRRARLERNLRHRKIPVRIREGSNKTECLTHGNIGPPFLATLFDLEIKRNRNLKAQTRMHHMTSCISGEEVQAQPSSIDSRGIKETLRHLLKDLI